MKPRHEGGEIACRCWQGEQSPNVSVKPRHEGGEIAVILVLMFVAVLSVSVKPRHEGGEIDATVSID